MSSSRKVLHAPATPTPSLRSTQASSRTPIRTVIGPLVLNRNDFVSRKPLREDRMFAPFKDALGVAKTLVSFAYKADRCQGKLVQIP